MSAANADGVGQTYGYAANDWLKGRCSQKIRVCYPLVCLFVCIVDFEQLSIHTVMEPLIESSDAIVLTEVATIVCSMAYLPRQSIHGILR